MNSAVACCHSSHRPGETERTGRSAGNTGLITFGWGFLWLLLLSALVWWLTLKVMLPRSRVDENIDEVATEAAEEEAELGAAP